MASADATEDTLFTEPNVYPTSMTEPTLLLTAQWPLSLTLNRRSVCRALMDASNAQTATLVSNATLTSSSTRPTHSATKSAVTENDMSRNATTETMQVATAARPHAPLSQATLAEEDLLPQLTTASSTLQPRSPSA